MEGVQSKLSVSAMTAYLGVLKEPRGLIRLLQFIFAICAFATACNGGSSIQLLFSNDAVGGGVPISASWSYPYNLQASQIQVSTTSNPFSVPISDANDVKPSAQFFVFTGVTSMLISLAFLIIYILLDRQYRNDERLPIIDLIVTIIWMIFWLAGSAAWAKGVSNIRSLTNSDAIAQRTRICTITNQCREIDGPGYGNIIVSVIFGFLNFILWAGSAWFIYKETKFFKNRSAQQQQQQTGTTGNQSNFTDFGSPNVQQQQEIR